MENYGNFQKECVTRENLRSKNSLRGQNWKPPGRAAGRLQREAEPLAGSSLAPRAQLKLPSGNGARLVKYFGHKY